MPKHVPYSALRFIVDDHGDRRLYRRCCGCRSWKPCNIRYYAPRKRDKRTRRVMAWDGYCRACRNAKQRLYYARLSEERRAEYSRQAWRRLKADADALAERRKRNAEQQRAFRQANPERAREISRASYHRVMSDPERRARQAEAQRMNYRLRREQQTGQHPEEMRRSSARLSATDRSGGTLPIAPLIDRVRAYVGEDASERKLADLGLEPRAWHHWRTGNQTARFDTLDAVLSGLGLHPWDVWTGDDLVRACELWGHDVEDVAA